jgi:hypothetical protein
MEILLKLASILEFRFQCEPSFCNELLEPLKLILQSL